MINGNLGIIVLSRKKTAFFNDAMKAAVNHYWPNHWRLNINIANNEEDFLTTLSNILKNAPPIFLLILEDHIPVKPIDEEMMNFAAEKIITKEWHAAATFISRNIPVEGKIEGGWARISDDSEWKANMQPTIWDKDFLSSIIWRCKEIAAKEKESRYVYSVRSPWGFDRASAKMQKGKIVYRAVKANPWPMPHSGFMWGGKVWLEELNAEFRKHGLAPLKNCPLPIAGERIKNERYEFNL